MTTAPSGMDSWSQVGERWGSLARLPDAERINAMRDLLIEIIAIPEEQRDAPLEAMVSAEYALDDATLHAFTSSRLRAWLALASEDMDAVRALSRSWDRVFDRMPAVTAMRRATVVQTVARSELSSEEVGVLFELIPSIVRQIPRAPAAVSRADPQRTETPAEPDRPWWKFWG